MTIWKYVLKPTNTLDIPLPSTILDVQVQGGELCLWVVVDPRQPAESVEVSVYGTGHALPSNPGEYLGTAQMNDGKLVLHVFAKRGVRAI